MSDDTWPVFVTGDEVRVLGQDIAGVVEGVGKKKITILPRGGRFDGMKLSLPPILLIHTFGEKDKWIALGEEISIFERE